MLFEKGCTLIGKSSLLRKEVKLKMTKLPHVNVYAKLKKTELPHVSVYAFKLNHMNPYLRKGHFMTETQYLDQSLQFDQESTDFLFQTWTTIIRLSRTTC